MRLAVIGLGRMGRFYATTVASLAPAVELAAVADPDPVVRSDLQLRLGVTDVFADFGEVLEQSAIDGVIVATPTVTHADVVIAAANAGKAIFCEKPLALTVERTLEVVSVVERAGVLLQVGFMRRFDPAYRHGKELIDNGAIGRPTTFKAIGRDPDAPPLNYADPRHSGGLLVDLGVHDFDLARWLMSSEVEEVSAFGGTLVFPELGKLGDMDNAVVNLRFADGSLGNVETSRNARYGYDIRTEVLGSEGTVRIGGSPPDDVVLLSRSPASAADDTPHFVRRFGEAYRAQIEHFVDCVQHDRLPSVGGADALAAIRIAQAATQAARSGSPVKLERGGVSRTIPVQTP